METILIFTERLKLRIFKSRKLLYEKKDGCF